MYFYYKIIFFGLFIISPQFDFCYNTINNQHSLLFMDQHLCEKGDLLAMRHSCEHVLMEAMEHLFPGILKAMGPATKEGFYFDFDLPEGIFIKEEDFPRIEKEMRRIMAEKKPFHCEKITLEKGRELFHNNPYKLEWLQDIENRGQEPTLYWTGNKETEQQLFVDLCAGPHVPHTGNIGSFKLLSIAGAYWRGNSKNKMLTRIYGTAFPTEQELKDFLRWKEESKARDHRKLGKELELFTFCPETIGQGLPLWLPKGTIIRDELETWAREMEKRHGYERVVTPILAKEKLYECSGHLAHYKEDMYSPIVIEEEEYYLRPMNCPHHHQIYSFKPRSYRDLPIRLAEYGNVFRYEASGGLSGLMRTRGFCMNDAHIYCRYDQAQEEFAKVLNMYLEYYKILGIEKYCMHLCTADFHNNPEKYTNDPEGWEKATDIIRNALKQVDFPYLEVRGDAAFYGPKVDVQIFSAIGTEYTISTNQLDFLGPKRFNLTYKGSDGEQHPVYIIHRAPLSTHERMVAYLIEHFGGAFPLWLSPVQISIIPVSEEQEDYGREIKDLLQSKGFRVELKDDNNRMGYKIRESAKEKIPYALILGAQEKEQNTLSVRDRSGKQENHLPKDVFISMIQNLIQEKSLDLWKKI